MGSGRAIEVQHPELMLLSPSGRAAAVYGPDDTLEIVDIFLVQSIDFLKRKNGSRRRAG